MMNYDKFEGLVIHMWIKMVWEKCFNFYISVKIKNIALKPPRREDTWLMQAFNMARYWGAELVRLNRV